MIKTQPVKKLLSSDFGLIMDAIRRLEEGTCCLLDDDKIAAMDIFQRLKQALKDHVSFEESNLPAVVEYLRHKGQDAGVLSTQMHEEHQHIMGLLDAAEHELFEANPIPFRSVIKSLKSALHDHLQIEEDVPYEIWRSDFGEAALKRMAKRAEDGFLGLD
ncbi:MAG: hemerythrin domain-containing protein [Bdellovibrionota bacterium]